jgi:hypothetical protein
MKFIPENVLVSCTVAAYMDTGTGTQTIGSGKFKRNIFLS